jgi:hypothetical protein
MHIDVKEQWRHEVVGEQTSLFERLTLGRVHRTLGRIDVPTRLYPNAESTMSMKHDTSRRHDEGGRRDVVVIRSLIERVTWPLETFERRVNRVQFAFVDRGDRANLFA